MTRTLSLLLLAGAATAAGPAADPPRVDTFGDPLPDGAKARIGTTRMVQTLGGAYWAGAALTRDGKYLISPTRVGLLARIDVATGRTVGRIGEAAPYSTAYEWVHLSADGKRVAQVSSTTATVRDTQTGRILARIEPRLPPGSASPALSALSADGTTLAVGAVNDRQGEDKALTAVVWDVDTGRKRAEVTVEPNLSAYTALSSDGRVLATWGGKKTLHIDVPQAPETPIQFWDTTTGKALSSIADARIGFSAVTFSPDGTTAAFGSGKGTICVVDPKTGREVRQLRGRADQSYRPFYSPDGKTLAGGGWDGTVRLWNFEDAKEVGTTKCPDAIRGSGVKQIVFTGDRRAVAWDIQGSTAVVWEVPSGKVLSPYDRPREGIHALAFTPDGKEVLIGGPDWTIRRWDPTTGKPLGTITLTPPANIYLDLSYRRVRPYPDGKRAHATAGLYTAVPAVYDLKTGTRLYSLPFSGDSIPCRDGELLLSIPKGTLWGAKDPQPVTVRDAATGDKITDLEMPGGNVYFAGRTPDRRTLVTLVSAQRPDDPKPRFVVTRWDLATGQRLHEVTEPGSGQSFGLTLSPDGKTALLTDREGKLRALDLTTGKVTRRFDTGRLAIHGGPAVSPDGKLVAVGLWDPGEVGWGGRFDIPVFEIASGEVVRTFTGHAGLIGALAFSPDGKTLASGSYDTTVLLWDLTGPARKP
jgi:WD40 repeat protein